MKHFDFWIRFIAAWVWFTISTAISMLMMPFRWKNPNMGHTFAQITAWGCLPIMGWRVKVENPERLTSHRPCIYIVNHQSNVDIMTFSRFYPTSTVIIGKKQLRWVPLFGLFFEGCGNIMIDRANRSQSMACLDSALDAIKARNVSVMIFPEGTRNRGAPQLLPFKKGAFYMAIKGQIPIVPIAHQHLFSYLDYTSRKITPGEVRVKVLEPISTAGMTIEQIPQLLALTQERMATAMLEPGMGLNTAPTSHLRLVSKSEPK